MGRDIRIGLITAAGVVGLLSALFVLMRYAVPMVLSLRFSAALVAGWAVAVAGVLLIVWLAWRLWSWIATALRRG
ncbi:hypothetical protein ASG17_08150 [Brevundimonas sp. Leaf363]|uniref:hypothetical protein n=1 Tax=Brevundimonas sp. Leaf363 TaxID=1736353 RepID=UPI0006F461DF|nr:hypothetical protein [Brevundimonas sp. Leaf363]KQS56003.1 hypothetical protein ASG17_08150 [Brevundimonas sp. Leaf363]